MKENRRSTEAGWRQARYHFVGVAGTGMSALAQAVLHRGVQVTGSDRYCDRGEELEVVTKLRRCGVRFFPQDGSGVSSATTSVVVSTAIEADNADLAAAKALGIPVVHRAELLARVAAEKTCIAITGTSGKSTVAGMIGWVLEQLGEAPEVVNGAPVLNWVTSVRIGNFRGGAGRFCVVEADESDRSLLQLRPDWAVITNVSKDHFDLDTARGVFDEFRARVRSETIGPVNSEFLRSACFHPETSGAESRFQYKGVTFCVALPGLHNAENGLLAAMLCERLGFSLGETSLALRSFRGIQRRLEFVGVAGGVTVVDDYAHNPAKIRACWSALSEDAPRILAVWRPHGFRPLALMMEELAVVFGEICRPDDRLMILPVYDAGGTADRTVRSEMLVEKLRTRGVIASSVAGYSEALEAVLETARSGDTVVVMGARDPGLPHLARTILKALEARGQTGGGPVRHGHGRGGPGLR